jgi:hypothetical protein
MTIHFDPRAIERRQAEAKAEAFRNAEIRRVFGRKGQRREPVMSPEFALALIGVVGLILIVGFGV